MKEVTLLKIQSHQALVEDRERFYKRLKQEHADVFNTIDRILNRVFETGRELEIEFDALKREIKREIDCKIRDQHKFIQNINTVRCKELLVRNSIECLRTDIFDLTEQLNLILLSLT